tara:strand:+ start:108 stop:227 length:120 start_codon:yes stop_codon:yes gene_type:complete
MDIDIEMFEYKSWLMRKELEAMEIILLPEDIEKEGEKNE